MKKRVQMFLISIVDTIRTRIVDCAELRKSALNNLFSSIDCLSLCPYLSFHQVDDTTLQTISTTTFIYNVAIE